MRGKDKDLRIYIEYVRITPAHAGKSPLDNSTNISGKDHPRPCGEKGTCKNVPFCCIGSPPPMRGKVTAVNPDMQGVRITPAHAGKSRHSAR